MSKKDKRIKTDLDEKDRQAYSRGRLEGIVFTLVTVGFIAASCFSVALVLDKIKGNEKEENSSSLSSTVDTVDNNSQTGKKELSRELLSGDSQGEELEHVNSILNRLRNSNTAFIVENSQGYDGYMYNKYGECIQQNSDSSVSTLFTADGHSVRINAADGTIALEGSIDILTTCENVLRNAIKNTNGYSVYKTESSTDSDGVTYSSCIINIKGLDACKTLYENLGDEMSDSAVKKLKELVDTELGDGFDWTPEFEYVFVYSDNEQFGVQCNCIINGEAQNNWYADGYQETAEWKLSDSWKNVDWSDNTTENFDKICEQLTKELELIDSAVSNKTDDTGESTTTEETQDTQSTQGTSDNTQSTSESTSEAD